MTDEKNIEIGFDFDLLQRNELYVNLIYLDFNLRSSENYGYYNYFKVDVVGGFQAMDNVDMLIAYLEAIKNKSIPFIVITSGSSGKDVIPICRKYSFVKEVIIFCSDVKTYQHFTTDYPQYVKKVLSSINDVYNYIKTLGKDESGTQSYLYSDSLIFSSEDIKMNKQLEQCPVISAYEYDKLYFLIHRAYAHFFKDIKDKKNVIFNFSNFIKVKDYINSSKIIKNTEKRSLIEKFNKLKYDLDFVENSIRKYTGESSFCYIFNRTMRNFEPGLISLAYYMGPFLFAANKYVKENQEKFGFNGDMTLYRNIQCSIFDFYLYYINSNHIICFPSITSTSTVKGKFHPTEKAKSINNIGVKQEDMIKITMIFQYKHEKGNISPGIIVKYNEGKDGNYLSSNSSENEVILFPFTFVRITEIKRIDKTNNIYEIYFDIINRKEYIEYTLRDNVQNRPLFSKLD